MKSQFDFVPRDAEESEFSGLVKFCGSFLDFISLYFMFHICRRGLLYFIGLSLSAKIIFLEACVYALLCEPGNGASYSNTPKHTATAHCNNTLQHTATHLCELDDRDLYCNTLQHTATTHCNNTLQQHSATTLCNTLQHTCFASSNVEPRIATHCNILQQHIATAQCNNTLQHTGIGSPTIEPYMSTGVYIYKHIYMYVYTYVCVHIYTYIYMYIYIHT